MEITSFFKNPVNEILATAPTGKTAGYRYINSTDWIIYELHADGSWVADSEFSIGAQVAVVGKQGDSSAVAHYINAAVVSEVLTPYFGTGNIHSENVANTLWWKDRLLVYRQGTDYGAILCIMPNGDSYVLLSLNGSKLGWWTVDSRDNLWVGYMPNTAGGTGVTRVSYADDLYNSVITFSKTNEYIESDSVCGVVAIDDKVWIFMNEGTKFFVNMYDGYEFNDMTSQFQTDTGIDTDAMTALKFYKASVDDNGMLIFTMADASFSGNMFYYSGGVFYKKTIPSTMTNPVIQDFVKYGDYVLCVTCANSTPAAGRDVIWQWSNVANVVYDANNSNSMVVPNGEHPFTVGSSKIYLHDLVLLPAPTEQTAWEADILAILTANGATAAYKGFAVGTNEFSLVNYDGSINTILKIVLTLKWAV